MELHNEPNPIFTITFTNSFDRPSFSTVIFVSYKNNAYINPANAVLKVYPIKNGPEGNNRNPTKSDTAPTKNAVAGPNIAASKAAIKNVKYTLRFSPTGIYKDPRAIFEAISNASIVRFFVDLSFCADVLNLLNIKTLLSSPYVKN